MLRPRIDRHAALAALLGVVLGGSCARDVTDPDPPPGAPCVEIEDCNPTGGVPLQGQLRACVDQRCEIEPSIAIPCTEPSAPCVEP